SISPNAESDECSRCAKIIGSEAQSSSDTARNSRESRFLLAVDLDGTLFREDGTVDARDAAALQRAMDAGVVVTFATGRLAPAVLATARALGIDMPVVCADGAALVCVHTGRLLESEGLAREPLDDLLFALSTNNIAPFVFLHDGAHSDPSG